MTRLRFSPNLVATSIRSLSLILCVSLAASRPASGQAYSTEYYLGPAGTYFGWSVASMGDLTGDGIPEFAVGAPASSGLFVYPPTPPGQVRVFAGATGGILLQINGTAANDRFGASVASLGDVNGDGISDFVVGAPQATTPPLCYCGPGFPPQWSFGPGYARVFSGATGIPLYTVTGSSMGDFFGESVAGTGDLDADTVPDFVVAATQRISYGGGPGYVRTISGLTGTPLLNLAGGGPCGGFRTAVAGTGDVDGDGLGDLIVGSGGWPGAGCARVLSGPSLNLLSMFSGSSPTEAFGASVAGPGDLDGDGTPDFLVGAPAWSSPTLPFAGQARALSGAAGSALFEITGSAAYEGLGTLVGRAGNVDGDPIPDVFASDVFGWGDEKILAASGIGGAPIFVLEEDAASLSTAGDQDGDGLDDVLFGDPSYAGVGMSGGIARVFSTTGIPANSYLFGAGCPGSSGLVPGIGAMGGDADVGNGNPGFGIRLLRARALAPAILIAGASSQSWGGVSLPFDLGPAGIPGCSLLVAPEALIPTATSATGLAEIQIPIPPSPALSGGLVFLQWYVADPGPLLLPGAMSQGLALSLF